MILPTRASPQRVWAMVVAFLLIGCSRPSADQRPVELSATATAESSTSGQIVLRESTAEKRRALEELSGEIARIDSVYPRPPLPNPGAPRYRVSAVELNGQIALENDRRAKMDGVSCSAEGIGYLSRMLIQGNAHVVFRQTRPATAEPIPAEVWLVDSSAGQLPPAYSLIAETALTSGWCEPDNTAAPRTNERFKQLAALGARMKAIRQNK